MQTLTPTPDLTNRPDQPSLPIRKEGYLANGTSLEPLHSIDLLKGRKSVAIEHEGLIYRLQLTKLGKLILTK